MPSVKSSLEAENAGIAFRAELIGLERGMGRRFVEVREVTDLVADSPPGRRRRQLPRGIVE